MTRNGWFLCAAAPRPKRRASLYFLRSRKSPMQIECPTHPNALPRHRRRPRRRARVRVTLSGPQARSQRRRDHVRDRGEAPRRALGARRLRRHETRANRGRRGARAWLRGVTMRVTRSICVAILALAAICAVTAARGRRSTTPPRRTSRRPGRPQRRDDEPHPATASNPAAATPQAPKLKSA